MKTDIKSALLVALLVLSGVGSESAAQGEVDRASDLGRQSKWAEAKQVLAPVIATPAYQTNGHAWFVMGFIHKELHKELGEYGADAPERASAATCLQRAIQMGLNAPDREMANEAMDFLARSYFREAIGMVEGFTWGATDEILALFGRYEAIQLALDPGKNMRAQRSDLNRYLGQAHALLLDSDHSQNPDVLQAIFEAAIGHYEEALRSNPEDYATQYNLAITLYNQGVRKLKTIGHETSMFELMEVQDVCIQLFEQALVPMQDAHMKQPERLETLKGLMTLHYALSQKSESDRYKAEIERILGER